MCYRFEDDGKRMESTLKYWTSIKKRKINDKLNNPHHVKLNTSCNIRDTLYIYASVNEARNRFSICVYTGRDNIWTFVTSPGRLVDCTLYLFFFYSALTFFRWIRQNGTTFRDFSLASSKTSLKLDEESMLLSLKLSRFPCGGRTIYDVTLSPLPFLYKRRVTWLDAWWKFGHVTRTSA